MRKLILHIGTHKTGTTSIQSYASSHRRELLSKGVYYPKVWEHFPTNSKLASAQAHFRFASALSTYSAEDRDNISHFREHLLKNVGDDIITLISAESLYRHIDNDDESGGFDERRRRFIARLAEFCDGFETEVVAYFRRPDSFCESMYAEGIVNSVNKRSFSKWLVEWRDRYSYRKGLDAFRKQFKVSAFCFEDHASNLEQSFFNNIGVLGLGTERAERLRVSIPKSACLWIVKAKQEGEMTDLDRRFRWLFSLQSENADIFQSLKESSFWKDVHHRNVFLEKALSEFPEVRFPSPRAEMPPTVKWGIKRHEKAETRYLSWKASNAAILEERERKRLAPFQSPQINHDQPNKKDIF